MMRSTSESKAEDVLLRLRRTSERLSELTLRVQRDLRYDLRSTGCCTTAAVGLAEGEGLLPRPLLVCHVQHDARRPAASLESASCLRRDTTLRARWRGGGDEHERGFLSEEAEDGSQLVAGAGRKVDDEVVQRPPVA